MTATEHAQLVERRAELMAELFLQELDPLFVTSARDSDIGYDYLIGFSNADGGVDTYAVQVRATEENAGRDIKLERRLFNRLAKSNLPALLLVIDVKNNEIFYSLPVDASDPMPTQKAATVPLTHATDETKQQLRLRISGSTSRRATRGSKHTRKTS